MNCGAQVYAAAALQEFHSTKDKAIAFKIFEVGYKLFNADLDFCLAYLDLLIQTNEENSM